MKRIRDLTRRTKRVLFLASTGNIIGDEIEHLWFYLSPGWWRYKP